MAIVRKIILPGFATIGVWKIEETENELIGQLVLDRVEEARLNKVTHPHKRIEWLASRLLLKRILNTRKYLSMYKDAHGKPHLEVPVHHSISHTTKYAAVIVSRYYKVGIDIESSRPGIKRIAHKFISIPEKVEMEFPDNFTDMMLIWGAKEVMYKIYGLRQVDFRIHMMVYKFPGNQKKGALKGELKKGDYAAEYDLLHWDFDDYMLVFGREVKSNRLI